MLTFNRPQFIGRALASIQAQTFEDWEVLVVHDGPNEEIARIVEEWTAREPRVRYFRRREIGNIAQANNYGIARARGEYLAVLDDDDYWLTPEKLAWQVAFLDTHRDHVCCGGGAVCIDQQGRETLRYLRPEKHEDILRRALLTNPMVHSTSVFRRAEAVRAGGYDESLPGFQDWDLFLKLARAGRLHNLQEYLLGYQIWEGGGSFKAQRGNTWSAVQIVRRHGPHYNGYPLALAAAWTYYAYARLPLPVRRATFSMLSRGKKALFSAQPARKSNS
jgi:hypothetical protein